MSGSPPPPPNRMASAEAFQSALRAMQGGSRRPSRGRWMVGRPGSGSSTGARQSPQQPQQQQQPAEPVVVVGSRTHILVSLCQKGNPVLAQLNNVPWFYANILPDYVIGERCCVLYLSVRYHQLHSGRYLQTRIAQVGRKYDLRLVLLHVDQRGAAGMIEDAIQEVTRIATLGRFTVLCAWSHSEVARWLEALKMFEPQSHVPKAVIPAAPKASSTAATPRGAMGSPIATSGQEMSGPAAARERAIQMLTMVPSVNRSDALALLRHFGAPRAVIRAPLDQLLTVRGIGTKKARFIFDAFHQPVRLPLLHSAVASQQLSQGSSGSQPLSQVGAGSAASLALPSLFSSPSTPRAPASAPPSIPSASTSSSSSSSPSSSSLPASLAEEDQAGLLDDDILLSLEIP